MQQKNKELCDLFEIEVWLYISGELNEERRKAWKLHLAECAQCSALLESNKELSEFYSDNMSEDMLDSVFEKAVAKATTKLSLIEKIKYHVTDLTKSFAFGKIVLGSSLVTAALIIMFLAQNTNPVKQLTETISKWDDNSFNTKVEEISKSIKALDRNASRSDVEWAKSVGGIETKLDSLKININD
jgi:hypothetical protein